MLCSRGLVLTSHTIQKAEYSTRCNGTDRSDEMRFHLVKTKIHSTNLIDNAEVKLIQINNDGQEWREDEFH